MNISKENWNDLKFGVRRSIRYHLRRRKFYDTLGFLTNFLTIITGGGVIVSVCGDKNKLLVVLFGALTGIFSAIDLLIGSSVKARDHHDFVRKFSELERKMVKADEAVDSKDIIKLTNERLEIEENEPPVYRVLDADCHNEMVTALGKPESELVNIEWYQRLFMHIIDIAPNKLRKSTSGR